MDVIREENAMIVEKLEGSGYRSYADLLKLCLMDGIRRKKRIAIVGDALVGKSTFINELIGRDVLPTGVIPFRSKLIIGSGHGEKAMDAKGNVFAIDEIEDHLEDLGPVMVQLGQWPFGEDIELVEFPDLVPRKREEGFEKVAKLYGCDATVLVMSAGKLLSERERTFIDDHIDLFGSERLLLTVNKLDLLPEEEGRNVLDYLKVQMGKGFPNVRCFIMHHKEDSRYLTDQKDVRAIIEDWGRSERPIDRLSKSIRRYLSEKLNKEKEGLEDSLQKTRAERKKEEQMRQMQRERDETSVEQAIVEFQIKRNSLIEKVDTRLKNNFMDLKSSILKKLNAPDGVAWYKKRLESYWKSATHKMSIDIDANVMGQLKKDIDQLNGILGTQLRIEEVELALESGPIDVVGSLRDYGKIKKSIPIGLGGGVIAGFCLFKVMGAVLGLAGTSALSGMIVYQDMIQNDMIKKKINEDIDDIARKVRRISVKEIDRVYGDALDVFKDEAKDIIDSRYVTIKDDDGELRGRISQIDDLLMEMEG